jgi:hypothetical protein
MIVIEERKIKILIWKKKEKERIVCILELDTDGT